MKIKELHLRNIASIESADIDFENGLKDGITGLNAATFLIGGDTGAGKSVILDGISMALYKTTPRIKGVANVNKNTYSTSNGESMGVGSIEQYTRLGISQNDECYSEVVFTGNDGKEYTARLTLGLSLGNTNKKTGIRPLKYKSPDWKMKIGNGNYVKADEKTLVNAIGLTYQQFSRMSMLAQGHFATFLVGDKKDREIILEQLTNTERFSQYGEAIKRIYDRVKAEKDRRNTEVDTFAQSCMQPEEVQKLNAEKTALDDDKKALDNEIKKNEETIAQVSLIENGRKAADKATASKKDFEAKKDSDEYKSAKALIEDWDNTEIERKALEDRKKAEASLKNARKSEAQQKETFTVFTGDLIFRDAAIKAMGDPKKDVDAKQAEIDTLTKKRDDLNPTKINSDLAQLNKNAKELESVSVQAGQIKKSEEDAAGLAADIEKDEETLKTKEEACTTAETAYKDAKTAHDAANSIFTTMSASANETIIRLRKSLIDTHADTCPLCGQKISEISLDDEFRKAVAPLEEKEKETKAALDEAEKILKKATSERDSFAGALKTNKGQYKKLAEGIESSKTALSTAASKFGIDIAAPLPEQIAKVKEEMAKSEEMLKAAQKEAEDLLEKINASQKEKNALDEALAKFNAAKTALESIKGVSKSITEVHPDWADVTAEAKEYPSKDIAAEWNKLLRNVSANSNTISAQEKTISECQAVLNTYYTQSGKSEADLEAISVRKTELTGARKLVKETDENLKSATDALASAEKQIKDALAKLGIATEAEAPKMADLDKTKKDLKEKNDKTVAEISSIEARLETNAKAEENLKDAIARLAEVTKKYNWWDILNSHFGGTRFRTLVQTYILRPLLNNANIYLEKITDRYLLTCSEENEQLSILVLDRYNKDQVRSATVLSGGERFMISLALSLALSSLNRPDMNVNILFIDEGFGTLDEKSLESVMQTLEKLQEIAGQTNRRVGIISHREELYERIPVQIQVKKKGQGRSVVQIQHAI